MIWCLCQLDESKVNEKISLSLELLRKLKTSERVRGYLKLSKMLEVPNSYDRQYKSHHSIEDGFNSFRYMKSGDSSADNYNNSARP